MAPRHWRLLLEFWFPKKALRVNASNTAQTLRNTLAGFFIASKRYSLIVYCTSFHLHRRWGLSHEHGTTGSLCSLAYRETSWRTDIFDV